MAKKGGTDYHGQGIPEMKHEPTKEERLREIEQKRIAMQNELMERRQPAVRAITMKNALALRLEECDRALAELRTRTSSSDAEVSELERRREELARQYELSRADVERQKDEIMTLEREVRTRHVAMLREAGFIEPIVEDLVTLRQRRERLLDQAEKAAQTGSTDLVQALLSEAVQCEDVIAELALVLDGSSLTTETQRSQKSTEV